MAKATLLFVMCLGFASQSLGYVNYKTMMLSFCNLNSLVDINFV